MLKKQIVPAIAMTLVLCVMFGVAYPFALTGLAQVLFPSQANGSLVTVNGRVVGSTLIGQPFTRAEYFHSRPSAVNYDGANSLGTNKGPTDLKLADSLVGPRVDSLIAAGVPKGAVPSDAVTASSSGLDPDVSPANAYLQVARIARARGVDSAAVRRILDAHVEGRQFGFFGEPRVNVLMLNIALDSAFTTRPTATINR
jgi:K+-transporting ATPase ATPase C chain